MGQIRNYHDSTDSLRFKLSKFWQIKTSKAKLDNQSQIKIEEEKKSKSKREARICVVLMKKFNKSGKIKWEDDDGGGGGGGWILSLFATWD